MRWLPNPDPIELDLHGGADVDIAIDVATDAEFDAVAASHFAAVQRRFPHARLERVDRADRGGAEDPRHNWTIVAPDDPTFRTVEMYRAGFAHVVSHHVGMVSGAYTAAFGGDPGFYVSARFGLAMSRLETPNYYYFASRKTTPQRVVMKYLNRGFGVGAFPPGIRAAIGATFGQDPDWNGDIGSALEGYPRIWDSLTERHVYPALVGKANFSAYALRAEAELARARRGGRILNPRAALDTDTDDDAATAALGASSDDE